LARAVAAEIRRTAFIIGGINPQNLGDVLAAGLSGIGVSSEILYAPHPAEVARKLLIRLGEADSTAGSAVRPALLYYLPKTAISRPIQGRDRTR